MQNEMRDRLEQMVIDAEIKWQNSTRSFSQVCADHLIENGVIVPPCKVGDTVYIKNRPLIISFLHIEENNISFVIQFDCGNCDTCPFYEDDVSFEGEHDCKTMGYIEFTEEDIGKTVFLTREEAEQKLKGGERG